MENISDLKIVGLDPKRPPVIQDIPCIDLIFALSEQAPADWCEEFNMLMSKQPYTTRVDPSTGLFIETWVRQPKEIANSLERMKQGMQDCTRLYEDRIAASAQALAEKRNTGTTKVSEAQQALNEVIDDLKFDDPS